MPSPSNSFSNSGGSFEAVSASKQQGDSNSLNPALGETVSVIDSTSLQAIGSEASMLSNQAYSNSVQTNSNSVQNALANQQAMDKVRLSILGKAVNSVSNLGPLPARSAVDLLTGDELAQAIGDIKAVLAAFGRPPVGPLFPVTPSKLLELLREFFELLKQIEKQNEALQGDGTQEKPYTSPDTIYFEAPITIGFFDLKPSEVKFIPGKDNSVKVSRSN